MARETDKRWKGILQDWLIVSDMDTEDYELKPLNQQQVAILLGALSVYKWPTRWHNLGIDKDQLEALIGDIEYRLMLNQEGSMSIDYEAWKQANKEAIYEAINDVAKQIVSGRVTNISVGNDGTVTDPTSDAGDEDLPPDDPATPTLDESLAAKAGGCIRIYRGYQEILDDMNTWYLSGTVTQQQAETRLLLLNQYLDPTWVTSFCNYYYTVYMNSGGLISLSTELPQYFFCKGVNGFGFADYLYNHPHSPAGDIATLEVMAQMVTQAQIDQWFSEGIQVPASDYVFYPCTKVATEEFDFDMSLSNTPSFTTNSLWKEGHRFLIELSGTFQDADVANTLGDAMYFVNTSTGVKTFASVGFNGPGISNPTQAKVPYQANHVYAFTMDKGLGGDTFPIISKDNGTMAIPNVTGVIHIKITDLGLWDL